MRPFSAAKWQDKPERGSRVGWASQASSTVPSSLRLASVQSGWPAHTHRMRGWRQGAWPSTTSSAALPACRETSCGKPRSPSRRRPCKRRASGQRSPQQQARYEAARPHNHQGSAGILNVGHVSSARRAQTNARGGRPPAGPRPTRAQLQEQVPALAVLTPMETATCWPQMFLQTSRTCMQKCARISACLGFCSTSPAATR